MKPKIEKSNGKIHLKDINNYHRNTHTTHIPNSCKIYDMKLKNRFIDIVFNKLHQEVSSYVNS